MTTELVSLHRQSLALRRQVVGYALRLRGIRVSSHVGVPDAERARLQELTIAVDVELSGEHYPRADELARAADYAEIALAAEQAASEQSYRLLETFALRLARLLGERWPAATCVRVAVTKANVPTATRVAEANVEVTLGRAVG
jgi:dihydroneopterin aldolase